MATSQTTVTPDVQAGRPATEVSLTRVGVRGVEKVIHVTAPQRVGGRARAASTSPSSSASSTSTRSQAGVHMSRFEEVVNEAIDEVILGETLRAEELAGHIADQVRERQRGLRAEVTIAARYPETVPTPVSGPAHAGDLHPLRHRGRLRARHAHAHRGRGPGHDRLPLRAGAARPAAPASAWPPTASTTTRSSASSRPSPSPPTTSAGSARFTSAARRESTCRSTPATCCTSSRPR